MPMENTVSVTAPSDLPEGYELPVNVGENSSMVVTVPGGGVVAGQTFTAIPHLPARAEATANTAATERETTAAGGSNNNSESNSMNIPRGKFRNGFCDCCKHFRSAMFWLSCVCPSLTLGQIMQRLSLDRCAQRADFDDSNVFRYMQLWVAIGLITLALFPLAGIVIQFGFGIYVVTVMTKTRIYIRNKYDIPGNALSDCCLSLWCGCCNAIQMSSHINDFSKYESTCCSPTGVTPDVPSIV